MPASNALYSVAEIRNIERSALAALPPFALMQRAGSAASEAAIDMVGNRQGNVRILALAGPGNNGGDALEAAANLKLAGFDVTVLLFAEPGKQPADSARACDHARQAGVNFAKAEDYSGVLTSVEWSLVIDGLFGIGLARAIKPPIRDLVEILNRMACPVLALDVPSGLDADTGAVVGEDGVAVIADRTVTFIGNKPGLHTAKGRDHAGRVDVASLAVDAAHFVQPHASLTQPEAFGGSIRARLHDSHKGSYGDVVVAGGAQGMSGAAILAATTAAKSGAGRVFAAFLEEPPRYDPMHPELMCRTADEVDLSKAVVVLGPGLGMSDQAARLVERALRVEQAIVVDADGLNLIAGDHELQCAVRARRVPALMTPHPLEAARLLGTTATEVQSDRLAAARKLSNDLQAIVVLKGSGTVVARPDGAAAINPTGNPALATAGSGDVLAGLCGALLAMHWDPWDAARGAAWIHGHAADELVAQGIGPIGLTAGELVPAIRLALNELTARQACRRAG